MSYQCPPHIIKSTLSATIATAIASLGNVAFATTPDIPYDISKATELSLIQASSNPTGANRAWFGETYNMNHSDNILRKLTNAQEHDVDVIGGWIDRNTIASQVRDNQLFIAGANVNIKRAVSAYLGAKKDNTPHSGIQ